MPYRLEPQRAGNFYMCHSYGIQMLCSFYIQRIKIHCYNMNRSFGTIERDLGSVYFVGMDFNPFKNNFAPNI